MTAKLFKGIGRFLLVVTGCLFLCCFCLRSLHHLLVPSEKLEQHDVLCEIDFNSQVFGLRTLINFFNVNSCGVEVPMYELLSDRKI